jgi:hypothetical protein
MEEKRSRFYWRKDRSILAARPWKYQQNRHGYPELGGWLRKSTRKGAWKKRWFRLQASYLVYYKSATSQKPLGFLDMGDITSVRRCFGPTKHRSTTELAAASVSSTPSSSSSSTSTTTATATLIPSSTGSTSTTPTTPASTTPSSRWSKRKSGTTPEHKRGVQEERLETGENYLLLETRLNQPLVLIVEPNPLGSEPSIASWYKVLSITIAAVSSGPERTTQRNASAQGRWTHSWHVESVALCDELMRTWVSGSEGVSLDCLEADDRLAKVAVLGTKLMRHPNRYSLTVHIEERTGVGRLGKRYLSGTAIFPTSGSNSQGMLLVPCKSPIQLVPSGRPDNDETLKANDNENPKKGVAQQQQHPDTISEIPSGDRHAPPHTPRTPRTPHTTRSSSKEVSGGGGGGGGGDGNNKQDTDSANGMNKKSNKSSSSSVKRRRQQNMKSSSSKKNNKLKALGFRLWAGENKDTKDNNSVEYDELETDLVAEIYWRRIPVREKSIARLLCGFFCNDNDPKRWLQAHRPIFPALIRSMHPYAMEGALLLLAIALLCPVLWMFGFYIVVPYKWTLLSLSTCATVIALVRSKRRATLLQCFDWYRQDQFEITGAAVLDRAYAQALNIAASRQRYSSGSGVLQTDANGHIISTEVTTSTQPILYPHERILVQELRRRVRAECGHARLYMEPFMLVKFLRARNLNMDKAEKLLRDAIAWREEHRTDGFVKAWMPPPIAIDYVCPPALRPLILNRTDRLPFWVRDKGGRLTLCFRPGPIDWRVLFTAMGSDEDLFLKCGYWCLEMVLQDAIKLYQKEGTEPYWSVVIDLENWTLGKQLPITQAFRVSRVLLLFLCLLVVNCCFCCMVINFFFC